MPGKTKLILITVFFLALLGTGLSWGAEAGDAASPEAITAARDAAQAKATTPDKTAPAVAPIFFVFMGVQVNLGSLLQLKVLLLALALTAATVRRCEGCTGLLVGIGMIPRVEVTLIVGNIGLAMGVLNRDLFSAVIPVVLFTVLLTPPLLKWAIERRGS